MGSPGKKKRMESSGEEREGKEKLLSNDEKKDEETALGGEGGGGGLRKETYTVSSPSLYLRERSSRKTGSPSPFLNGTHMKEFDRPQVPLILFAFVKDFIIYSYSYFADSRAVNTTFRLPGSDATPEETHVPDVVLAFPSSSFSSHSCSSSYISSTGFPFHTNPPLPTQTCFFNLSKRRLPALNLILVSSQQ